MTDDELKRTVQELKDRQDIYDCLIRYCRGQDRLDADLTASAYHEDALEDHGGFVGPVIPYYVEWGQNLHRILHKATTHSLSNHSCEIDGNTAHAETYYHYTQIDQDGVLGTRTGRYIDRLEKRNGRWGIVARVCVSDCDNLPSAGAEEMNQEEDRAIPSARDRTDPTYWRPLTIDPKRFVKPPHIEPR